MKKFKTLLGILFFTMLIGMGNGYNIKAASATINIDTENSEVVVGNEVIVNININSVDFIGDFETNLSYDDNILEYISSSSFISGGNGFLKISAIDVIEGKKNIKLTIKFKALKAGTCDIGFTGRVMIFDFETGNEMPVSSDVLTIKVNAENTASSNNALKSLKVKPEGLEPKFDKKVFEYNIKLNKDIDALIINAVPEDEGAKTTIMGNKDLKEGDNKIIVTVIAESGAKQEYIINAFREYDEFIENQNPYEIFVEGVELLKFEDETYLLLKNKYKVINLKDDKFIPAGYVRTQMTIGDVTVDTFSPESNLQSDFILMYILGPDGNEGFYKYDRTEKTIQRFIEQDLNNKDDKTGESNISGDEVNRLKEKIERMKLLLIVISMIFVSILVITAIIIRKKNEK